MNLSRRQLLALTSLAYRMKAEAPANRAALWDYFVKELTAADERRRSSLLALRSAGELSALRTRVRRTMLQSIGAFPERTPINVEEVGVLQRPDYTIEKIIFESRPGFYVTANVYRPKSTSTRRPAVIQSCGHYAEGKAAPDYQRACIGLVKKGFVALIFDPLGQGERLMYKESLEKAPGSRPTAEHGIAGKPCFLVGRTLANYRIWDAMRALDYLESRSDVDKTRLGMLGHSGGGMMTLLISPLEDRLRAVMSCCAVTTFYHKFRAFLPGDPEQVVPNIYREGIDHPELIATVAPRAFLIGAALEDYVPLDGTRRTYEDTRRIFDIAGVPDNIGKVETPGPHALNKSMREACYGWMLKHLAGETGDVREPEFAIETSQNLSCAPPSGTLGLPGSQTVFDLNRSYARQLESSQRVTAEADLRRLLGLSSVRQVPKRLGMEGAEFRIESEPGIELPATLAPSDRQRVLLILVAEQGRNSPRAKAITRHLVETGYSVLGLDLRGWGETRPSAPDGKGKPLGEEFFVVHGIELGRPLLGMRVHDLLAAVRLVRGKYPKTYLVGLEGGGLVALHAAVLDHSISGVATLQMLISYRDVLEHALCAEPLASFVPAALVHYDLSQLAAGISPRPYVAVEPRDSLRRLLNPLLTDVAATREILDGLRLS